MKRIVKCLTCKKPVPLHLSYLAEIEVKQKTRRGYKDIVVPGHICPVCNKLMGYKTSKNKLDKFELAWKNMNDAESD